MDRKSFRKIIRYTLMIFIMLALGVTGVYFFIIYIVNVNIAQINEL